MSLDRRFCPHCEEILALRTHREHVRLFYDSETQSWTKKRKLNSDTDNTEVQQPSEGIQVQQQDFHTSYDYEKTVDLDYQTEDCTMNDLEHVEVGESGDGSVGSDSAGTDSAEDSNGADSAEESSDNEEYVEEDLDSEYESDSEPEIFSDATLNETPNAVSHHFGDLIRWILIFFFTWHITHNISALAIAEVLQFLSAAFCVVETHISTPVAVGLSALPATVYLAYKFLKIDSDNFVRHVLCPKCHSLYDYDKMLKDGSIAVKRCTHVAFPCHPQRNRRLPCSTPLVKPINLSSGRQRLYALHCYVSKSINDALQRILLRKEAHLKLETWRTRLIPQGFYADIYDGNVWKSFMEPLLKNKRSLALMINADWFQPFKHCTDSLGAIYLVILNLPRKERHKRENVILAGLIPALQSEPSTLNTFLLPIVKELQALWKGVRFYTSESPRYKVLVRGALLCAACDISAARKLCGFKGHNGNRGCSKCFKLFSGPATNKDYSGFDRENWPPRDLAKHRQVSIRIKKAKTLRSKSELETKYGINYTLLSELEYFNLITHCIVDPMHNLFLGTAKQFFKTILIGRGLLQDDDLKQIQARVDSVAVPSTIGRIPRKIASAFGGFTAEQWMDKDYKCWESFVLACRLLSSPVLSDAIIKKVDLLLLHFCRKVEFLYGKSEITPNMHLHYHLSDCAKDYGPIFGFWLFSFERYNGMLGKFPNNQKHIEIQLMQRFEAEMQLYSLPYPEQFQDIFFPFLKAITATVHDHHQE